MSHQLLSVLGVGLRLGLGAAWAYVLLGLIFPDSALDTSRTIWHNEVTPQRKENAMALAKVKTTGIGGGKSRYTTRADAKNSAKKRRRALDKKEVAA